MPCEQSPISVLTQYSVCADASNDFTTGQNCHQEQGMTVLQYDFCTGKRFQSSVMCFYLRTFLSVMILNIVSAAMLLACFTGLKVETPTHIHKNPMHFIV